MADKIDQIIKEYKDHKSRFDFVLGKLENLLKDLLQTANIKCHSLEARVKDEEGVRRKLSLSDSYTKLQDIKDLIGFRIITYLEDDIDLISNLIKNEFEIEEAEDKRKMLELDEFGYTSLHYVVKLSSGRSCLGEYKLAAESRFEIQVRSILQHAWAEIEHDLGYKSKIEPPKEIKRRFYRLAGLLEIANAEFTNIRSDLKEYAESVDKEIKDKPQEVLIDSVSLVLFVKQNSEIKALDLEFVSSIGFDGIDYSDERIGRIAPFLKSVGLNNMEEVTAAFKKYKNMILPFAKSWMLSGNRQTLPGGISLFYLCYVMLGASGSLQKAADYFLKNQIASDSNRANQLAEKVMTIFNNIKK